MKTKILAWLVGQLLGLLSPEILRTAVDKLLDVVEDAIAKSDTTIDDEMVLPVIKMIRETFNIPDND